MRDVCDCDELEKKRMFESLSSGCLEYFLFEPDSCVILMGELHFARMQWTYRWINRIFTVKYQVDFSRRMVVSTFLFFPVSQFVMHKKEFSYTRLSISFCVCVFSCRFIRQLYSIPCHFPMYNLPIKVGGISVCARSFSLFLVHFGFGWCSHNKINVQLEGNAMNASNWKIKLFKSSFGRISCMLNYFKFQLRNAEDTCIHTESEHWNVEWIVNICAFIWNTQS